MRNQFYARTPSYALFTLIMFYQTFVSAQLLGSFHQAPAQILSESDASKWLKERCVVRTDLQLSSFFITEQDGIPNAAEDLQVYLPLDIEALLQQ